MIDPAHRAEIESHYAKHDSVANFLTHQEKIHQQEEEIDALKAKIERAKELLEDTLAIVHERPRDDDDKDEKWLKQGVEMALKRLQ